MHIINLKILCCFIVMLLCSQSWVACASAPHPACQGDNNSPSAFYRWEVKWFIDSHPSTQTISNKDWGKKYDEMKKWGVPWDFWTVLFRFSNNKNGSSLWGTAAAVAAQTKRHFCCRHFERRMVFKVVATLNKRFNKHFFKCFCR